MRRQVLEVELETEMAAHLRYRHSDRDARTGEKIRNGTAPKVVTTEIGKPTELNQGWGLLSIRLTSQINRQQSQLTCPMAWLPFSV
jgi:hypothetical protein